jgi:hypothetical protein
LLNFLFFCSLVVDLDQKFGSDFEG